MDTLNKYPTPQDHLRIKYVASLVEIIDKLEKERSDADEVYTQLLERVDFGLKHIHSLLDLANAMIEREDDRINGVSPPRIIEQMDVECINYSDTPLPSDTTATLVKKDSYRPASGVYLKPQVHTEYPECWGYANWLRNTAHKETKTERQDHAEILADDYVSSSAKLVAVHVKSTTVTPKPATIHDPEPFSGPELLSMGFRALTMIQPSSEDIPFTVYFRQTGNFVHVTNIREALCLSSKGVWWISESVEEFLKR